MRATDFRWILRGDPFNPSGSQPTDDFPEILRHLVNQRGISSEKEIESFLRPKLKNLSDPFLIPGIRPAVERILHAIDSQENICIYGDYDVDGVSSITLMSEILRSYGISPPTFIPPSGPEGYGLSLAALTRWAERGTADIERLGVKPAPMEAVLGS